MSNAVNRVLTHTLAVAIGVTATIAAIPRLQVFGEFGAAYHAPGEFVAIPDSGATKPLVWKEFDGRDGTPMWIAMGARDGTHGHLLMPDVRVTAWAINKPPLVLYGRRAGWAPDQVDRVAMEIALLDSTHTTWVRITSANWLNTFTSGSQVASEADVRWWREVSGNE